MVAVYDEEEEEEAVECEGVRAAAYGEAALALHGAASDAVVYGVVEGGAVVADCVAGLDCGVVGEAVVAEDCGAVVGEASLVYDVPAHVGFWLD